MKLIDLRVKTRLMLGFALALAGQKDAAIAKMNAECRPLLAALLKAANDDVADNKGVSEERAPRLRLRSR